MRKIRDVLRLKFENNLSNNRIAQSSSISRSTVREYLARFQASGLDWPITENLDDEGLEQQLFASPGEARPRGRDLPDWHDVHKNLRRPGVTMNLLTGVQSQLFRYQYSRFCETYRECATSWMLVDAPEPSGWRQTVPRL